MTPLDTFLSSHALGFLLETTRLTGMMVVAPLTWSGAPARIKLGLVLALAFCVHGQAPVAPGIGPSPGLLALATISEFSVGAAMGFVVLLTVSIAEMAGNALAPMIGFGAAQVFDPHAHTVHSILAQHFRTLALLLAVITGLHRALIGSVLSSFRVLPPGTLVNPGQAAPFLIALTAQAMESGIRISMPILGILLMTQLALAFISRAAPAMQIFSVGFAVTLTVGLSVTVTVLPDIAREVGRELSLTEGRIEQVVKQVLPHSD